MAPLIVVPRLSIAKQLQSNCAGRAFGAGIGLMVGQLVQIKGLLRVVRGLNSDIDRPAIDQCWIITILLPAIGQITEPMKMHAGAALSGRLPDVRVLHGNPRRFPR